ncbi:hypothetical protein HS125_08370 [bacterium]|nr:hypothetical protein [bacterium]
METSTRLSPPPANYGEDYATGWNEVKWFDDSNDGNNNQWEEYSVTFTWNGTNDILAVGLESGSIEDSGGSPVVRWDSLIVEDLDAAALSVKWRPSRFRGPINPRGATSTPPGTAHNRYQDSFACGRSIQGDSADHRGFLVPDMAARAGISSASACAWPADGFGQAVRDGDAL